MTISRRTILAGGALLFGGAAAAKSRLKVSVFSKHLQFLQGEDLAKATAEIGFDGVDLAVRKGGHVEPATVAKDLPALVGMLRKNGLEVPMITTDIADAETPFAEDLLKAASALGIRYYRFGAYKWAADKPYAAQLEAMKPKLAKLAALNAKYQMCAMYHTHSGAGLVGASIWDLWYTMKDLDPKLVGMNYDIGHATIEGGLGRVDRQLQDRRQLHPRHRGEGYGVGEGPEGRAALAVEADGRGHGEDAAVSGDGGGDRFRGPVPDALRVSPGRSQ